MTSSKDALAAMAVRMAQMLRLNEQSGEDDPVSAEVKKRVFLSIFMADRWCSFGLALPVQIRTEELPSAKAIDEATFSSEDFGTRLLNDQVPIGLWGYKAELAVIFGQIQQFIRSVVMERLSPQDSDACADSMASMLMRWEQRLPHDVHFTDANLEAQKLKGNGSVFIDLHLGYHYYSMLLRFPFIGRRNKVGNEEHPEAARCRNHALAFSSLLAAGKSQHGCEIVHATVGHMTVISSSVLLYNLLSGTDDVVQISREHLSLNFGVIVELQGYWPCLTKWVRVNSSYCAILSPTFVGRALIRPSKRMPLSVDIRSLCYERMDDEATFRVRITA